MTADTSEWHRATITRQPDDLALTSWIMLEQLALRVDQTVWDAALACTLATTAGIDSNADRVMGRASLTEADEEAVAAFLAVARTPDGRYALSIPNQTGGVGS